MEFTKNMQNVMEQAVKLAREERHRYFMPEHIIYGMTFDEDFSREYEAEGGDVQALKKALSGFLREHAGTTDGDSAVLTKDTDRVLRMAEGQAESSGRDAIDISHFLSAILRLEDCYGVYYLTVQGVDMVEVIGEMSRVSLGAQRGREEDSGPVFEQDGNIGEGRDAMPVREESGKDRQGRSGWRDFVEDMNETCKSQNPLIGREEEMERTIQILCRKDKNNVLHVGEPGVGKTALAYGLALRIIKGQVPKLLEDSKIYALDMGNLIAGTQYRGDFEKRFKEIMNGLSKEKNPIVYLDEIHNIVGAGAVGNGSLDAANLLKPYLAAGSIRFMGATTYEEYKKHFEKNKSLVRRFQNIDINFVIFNFTFKIFSMFL